MYVYIYSYIQLAQNFDQRLYLLNTVSVRSKQYLN
jgi:hypothetical protein